MVVDDCQRGKVIRRSTFVPFWASAIDIAIDDNTNSVQNLTAPRLLMVLISSFSFGDPLIFETFASYKTLSAK
jgi:hypothetical protein